MGRGCTTRKIEELLRVVHSGVVPPTRSSLSWLRRCWKYKHWTWSAPENLAFSKSHHVIYIYIYYYISLCSSISIILRMLHKFMILKISTPNPSCYRISTCCEVGRIRLGWSGTFRQGRLGASEVSWERRCVLRAGGRKSGKAFWRCWCHCSGWTGPQLVHDLVY